MKVVYLAHPYGGDKRNIEDAKKYVEALVVKNPSVVLRSNSVYGRYESLSGAFETL